MTWRDDPDDAPSGALSLVVATVIVAVAVAAIAILLAGAAR